MPHQFINNLEVTGINELSKSDVLQVKEIETICNLSTWTATDYLEEALKSDSIFLIARVDDKIIGFLVLRVVNFDSDLLNFGILKQYQRKGIGGQLLDKLLDELAKKSIESIWLEVRLSNLSAIKFYSDRKFKKIRIRKNFYSNPVEDAAVMKLEIFG